MASISGALDTFPKFLLHNAQKFGARSAMRHKDFGIWQTWSWSEMLEEVRKFSIGLQSIGVKRGDKIAVVGSNRPRLYWSFSAIQALGAVPIPVYADSVAEEMVYVLQHAEVRFAIVQDQEQVDKLLSIKDQLPNLESIVYDWERGLGDYDEPFLHNFSELQETGAALLADSSKSAEADWLEGIASGKGEDLSRHALHLRHHRQAERG